MDPSINHPALVQHKGSYDSNPFITGAPVRVNATSLPGYFSLPAMATYSAGIFCENPLTSGSCVQQGTPAVGACCGRGLSSRRAAGLGWLPWKPAAAEACLVGALQD